MERRNRDVIVKEEYQKRAGEGMMMKKTAAGDEGSLFGSPRSLTTNLSLFLSLSPLSISSLYAQRRPREGGT